MLPVWTMARYTDLYAAWEHRFALGGQWLLDCGVNREGGSRRAIDEGCDGEEGRDRVEPRVARECVPP